MKGMKMEECRLMTYTGWPNCAVDPINLARAGFFYLGPPDIVMCAFCMATRHNWNPGDNPVTEHAKFTHCKFVLGQAVGNVPLTPARRQIVQVHLLPT